MRERMLVLAAVVATCAWGATAAAAAPIDSTGTLGAAPYRLVAPENWNGTLVVLAHGYRDRADHPGEIDDVSPDGGFTALIGALTASGYAVASTAYSSNGWAVKDAVQDLSNLAAFARGRIGRPERTLLVGFSLGSIPTLDLAEKRSGVFDGYLAACAVAAGSPRAWDSAAAGLVAWQTVFGSLPAAWGTVADGDDDVDFETEALPILGGLLLNPMNLGRFEFMRLVTRVPLSPGYYPGGLATNVFFITEARGELERRAGGPVAQNLTHTYALSAADRAYLGTLGISGAQIDAWLATMNGTRFAAPPGAAELDRALRNLHRQGPRPGADAAHGRRHARAGPARGRVRGDHRRGRARRPAVPGLHERHLALRLRPGPGTSRDRAARRVGADGNAAVPGGLPGGARVRPWASCRLPGHSPERARARGAIVRRGPALEARRRAF